MPIEFESMPQEERLAIIELLVVHLDTASSDAAAAGNTSLHAEIGKVSGRLKTCRQQISAADPASARFAVSAALRLLSRLQSRSPGATASARTGSC
jgi:hypothetical protein